MTANARTAPDPNLLKACMSKDEQAMLEKYLARATVVLEFGVGGSTGIAAQQPGIQLIGIDSHPDWIARCKKDPRIARLDADNRLSLYHVDIGPVGDWGFPIDPASAPKWPRYSLDIWSKLGGRKPDFVFVDGRFRLSCALQTLLNLPDVQYLCIHDFWSRDYYAPILDFVEVVDRVGELGVFRPKPDLDLRALGQMASKKIFERR